MNHNTQQKPKSGPRLLILVWATIFLGVSFLIAYIWDHRQEVEKRSTTQLLALVRLVEEHASSTIDRANITLLNASDFLTPQDFSHARSITEDRRKQIETQIKRLQQRTFGVVSMSITDSNGYVFANSVDAPPGLNLGDRKYFSALKAGPSAKPVVSEAIYGRVSKKWGVQIARRIEFPDGSFAGMIVANLGLAENFESFYQTINLGKNSLITLRDSDNRIMVRYPIIRELLGKQISGSEGTRAIAEGSSEGFLLTVSPVDHITRYVAYRKLENFPIYAAVGLSQNVLLKSWHADLKLTLAMIGLLLLVGGLITREIRVRQTAELALHLAKKNAENISAAKTKFLAAASHDLRQPLQAINLFLEVLIRTPLNADQQRIAGLLTQAVRSQGEMLNALLDISRLDAGVVNSVIAPVESKQIMELIDAEFSSIFLDRKLRFKLHFPRYDLAVLSDSTLLMSMLRNLIGNALKYTERGGVLVSFRPRGDRVLIQVWDTGIGIPAQHLDQIYDEYFQIGNVERDRSKGLGLGLSIFKRLAVLLGAEIQCHSRPGRGTVFSILLPRAELSEAKPGKSTADLADIAGAQWQGKKIVIIEDDPLLGSALESALTALEMKVFLFSDANKALEDPAIHDADFFLSDFRLPGDLDGLQVLDAIQKRAGQPIRAVLLTGDTSPGWIEQTRKANWHVLFKPVDLNVLLATLSKPEAKGASGEGEPHHTNDPK